MAVVYIGSARPILPGMSFWQSWLVLAAEYPLQQIAHVIYPQLTNSGTSGEAPDETFFVPAGSLTACFWELRRNSTGQAVRQYPTFLPVSTQIGYSTKTR